MLLQIKIIWEENNGLKNLAMYNNMNKGKKSIEQLYSVTIISHEKLHMYTTAGKQWGICSDNSAQR